MLPFNLTQNTGKLFEAEFTREILISEKLKATVLSIVPLVPCGFLIISKIFTSNYSFELYNHVPITWIIIFFLLFASYEFTLRSILGFYIKTKRSLPKIIRYANAFVEVSAPTIILFVLASVITPAYALLSPSIFAYFLFIFLSALCLDFKLSVFTGAVAALEYSISANFLIHQPHPANVPQELLSGLIHTQKGLVMLMAGIAVGLVGNQIKRRIIDSFISLEEKNEIVQMFGQYISPQIVKQLLDKSNGLSGEVQNVCVMFLDIRGFTNFCESKEPQEVVQYLNKLFDFSISIVNSHNGIINKFLGDGFMAIFGAPISMGNDCKNAALAASEIVQRIDVEVQHGSIPPTRVGIGIHVGEVVTGNVGSQVRKEYTIMGDVVNLASRIEQLNKEFHSQVLVSEAVWQEVSQDLVAVDSFTDVKVKGKKELVTIYQLI